MSFLQAAVVEMQDRRRALKSTEKRRRAVLSTLSLVWLCKPNEGVVELLSWLKHGQACMQGFMQGPSHISACAVFVTALLNKCFNQGLQVVLSASELKALKYNEHVSALPAWLCILHCQHH